VTLAADVAGNVFVAEIGAAMVRRVSPDGAITTVAGNGTSGYSGDGGPAIGAGLSPVTAIAADAAGNLFIAETSSPRIRKVATTGLISTIAGNGTMNITGDGGPAVSASICAPIGLAVDSAGNLFIASGVGRGTDSYIQGEYRVRKVAPDGTITTVAGMGLPPRGMGYGIDAAPDGSSALSGGIWPYFIAAGTGGNLFITDHGPRIRRVSPSGIISTVISTGAGTVSGLAADQAGNLFVADRNGMRKVDTAGVASSVPAPQIGIVSNRGGGSPIAADGGGNLFIATVDGGIQKVTPAGVITTIVLPTLAR
jgi:hypothetical protein